VTNDRARTGRDYYGFDSSQLAVLRFCDLLRIRTQLPDGFTRSALVACLQS